MNLMIKPGDAVLLNDPYDGGTHLPDLTCISPVFLDGRSQPSFFVASRAHHADVGGAAPGSLPIAHEVYEEGVRIPPVFVRRAGREQEGVLRLLLANVRTPQWLGYLVQRPESHSVHHQRGVHAYNYSDLPLFAEPGPETERDMGADDGPALGRDNVIDILRARF